MSDQNLIESQQLESFRSYVALLARWHWKPRLQRTLDPSDVVQNTLVNALNALPEFRGNNEFEMRAWLRQILLNELSDQARDFDRQRRDISREVSLEVAVNDSAVLLEGWLNDQQSSASERAERNEEIVRLSEALGALSDAQQEAVTLHHLHGLPIAEISEMMQRSPSAIGGLLKRGVAELRKQLVPGGTDDE